MKDLKSRGLLDSTLIIWHGEFGRMPISQRMDGRDHNPDGFTVWMAGGGVKGGTVVGATDQYGYRAVENRKSIYDLHATILHLLGLDHEKLTYPLQRPRHAADRRSRQRDARSGGVGHDGYPVQIWSAPRQQSARTEDPPALPARGRAPSVHEQIHRRYVPGQKTAETQCWWAERGHLASCARNRYSSG